ncbi:hypothetical protein [Clostridium estertheticum]|uniref:hypothetical protein n=1 Tax=Clostridium estertheticum TaxID=238834 RepID=UPI001C7CCB0D|nr:hypothetical protein [Clostridium estertheticum]MBX4267162.1 hypothetical protein [Clostridium estertheticum]WLC91285.1 hypothetical protein KTC95_24075 [Clostridium estertheticum]
MDNYTYKFSKYLYKKTDNKISDIVNTKDLIEIENIVNWLKSKGFVLYCVCEIKEIQYHSDPKPSASIPGSFDIGLSFDLGEKAQQFILVSIVNNVHVYDKTSWSIKMDDGLNIPIVRGFNYRELKKNIYNLPCLNIETDDMFEMLKNMG